MPAGEWFEFNTTTLHKGPANLTNANTPLGAIPAFAPAGSLVPLAPVVQSTQHLPGGDLEMQVYAGRDAAFTLVEDDGATTAYAGTSGAKRVTHFQWSDAAKTLSWTVAGVAPAQGFQSVFATVFSAAAAAGAVSASKALGDGGSIVVGK